MSNSSEDLPLLVFYSHSSSICIPDASFACLLKFVVWYFFVMPRGRLCSTIGKDSLYLCWSKLPGQIILYNVCRNLGSFVMAGSNS